jgi:hypothetical protein
MQKQWTREASQEAIDRAVGDGAASANRSNPIWGCPNTPESGSENPFDFVMCFLLVKFIV